METEYAEATLKDRLLKNRASISTATVSIDGVGDLLVRGLTRGEFLAADRKFPDDPARKEQYILSCAVVDPRLTMAEVQVWQESSGPLEINTVADKINELSGIKRGADKEAYKSA